LLNDDSSWVEVVSSRTLAQPLRAYNLTVKDFHTYFVAANKNAAPVWVHNECIIRVTSFETARNKALADIGTVNPSSYKAFRARDVGEGNLLAGKIVGFQGRNADEKWVRMRVDYDPVKGPHINVEIGKGEGAVRRAYIFPGTAEEALAFVKGNFTQ